MGMMTDGFSSTAIPKESGAARPTDKRTAYCRQQAAECALAATTAILGEVRQAYLNIEQAYASLSNGHLPDPLPLNQRVQGWSIPCAPIKLSSFSWMLPRDGML